MSYFVEKLIDIENEIRRCSACFEYAEQINKLSSVSFGISPNLLIVGESPSKNISSLNAIAWHNIDNKLTHTGKRMQKLLQKFNINLIETYYIEAIKCYPVSRKYLNFCNHHCKKFVNTQIEALSPDIVLLLGEYPTKAVLDIKNFNEAVGSQFKKVINDKEILFIPIYNPASVNFNRNFKILEEIGKELKHIGEQNDSLVLKRTI